MTSLNPKDRSVETIEEIQAAIEEGTEGNSSHRIGEKCFDDWELRYHYSEGDEINFV